GGGGRTGRREGTPPASTVPTKSSTDRRYPGGGCDVGAGSVEKTSRWSVAVQAVTDAADGQDPSRAGRVVFDLAAQVGHVTVAGAVVGDEVGVPGGLQQLPARVRPVFFGELGEDPQLDRRQPDRPALDRRLVAQEVDRDIAGM